MKPNPGKPALLLLAILAIFFCSSGPEGCIVLCAGDSITEQYYPLALKRIFQREGIRARVLNYGRSGYTSGEYFRFLDNNKGELEAEYPDFVLLQLGTNDVRVDGDHTPSEEFARNMRQIIAIFAEFQNRRGEKTKILLGKIPPVPEQTPFPFSPESGLRVVSEINPTIERIAAEERLTLVDNYSLFIREPQLLPEVHPTREGYKALARNWFESLRSFLK